MQRATHFWLYGKTFVGIISIRAHFAAPNTDGRGTVSMKWYLHLPFLLRLVRGCIRSPKMEAVLLGALS